MAKAGAVEFDISEYLEPDQLAEFDKLSPTEQMDVVAELVQFEFGNYLAEQAAKPIRRNDGKQLLLF